MIRYFLDFFRVRKIARDYNSERNTIGVLRFSDSKPSRVKAHGIELFHKPRLYKVVFTTTALSAVLIWTLRNYIEILQSILA